MSMPADTIKAASPVPEKKQKKTEMTSPEWLFMLSDTIHLLDVNWDNETRNNENRKSYQQFIVFHSLCTMYKSSIMRYLAK